MPELRNDQKLSILMKSIITIILSVLLISLISHTVNAAPDIKIVTEILPPYQSISNDQKLEGYAVDVVNALKKRLNIAQEIEIYPWARAYNYAINRPNVLIFSIARTPLRENQFYWIGKLHHEKYAFYSLKSNNVVGIKQLEDLKSYYIAVTRETALEQFLSQKNFVRLEKTNNMKHALKMLYKKRVDLVFGDSFIIKLLIKEIGYDIEQLLPVFDVPEINADLYIAMSKKTDIELVNRIKKEFELLQQENIISDIKKRWQM